MQKSSWSSITNSGMARLLSTAAWALVIAAAAAVALSDRAPELAATAAQGPSPPAEMQQVALTAQFVFVDPSARPLLTPAEGDPFHLQPPPAAPVPPTPTAPIPTPVVQLQPPPPQLGLQFAGRMVAPDGSSLLFAMTGNGETVQLTPGRVLPNGYQVKAVTPSHVEFARAGSDATARLDIPPLPPREIR